MCGHGPSFIQLLVVNNKQFRSYSSQRWGPKIRSVLLNPLSSWTGIPVVEAGSELPHEHLSQRQLCYGGQLSAIPSFPSLSLPSLPFPTSQYQSHDLFSFTTPSQPWWNETMKQNQSLLLSGCQASHRPNRLGREIAVLAAHTEGS